MVDQVRQVSRQICKGMPDQHSEFQYVMALVGLVQVHRRHGDFPYLTDDAVRSENLGDREQSTRDRTQHPER